MSYLKEIFRGISQRGEEFSLPAEEALWKKISSKPEVEALGPRLKTVIIGTDKKLSLVKEILSTHPEAEILLIERNSQTAEEARVHIPSGAGVRILVQDLFSVSPEDFPTPPQIVIAKHLIHLGSPLSLLEKMGSLLKKGGGTIFASTPLVANLLPGLIIELRKKQLAEKGIIFSGWEVFSAGSFQESSILFCFQVGIPVRNESCPKKLKFVPNTLLP